MAWRHRLALGITGFGKSTLLRRLIAQAWNQSPRVASLVLDPNLEGDWGEGAKVVIDDPDKYLYIAQNSESCLLIVDEAGEMLKRNPDYRWVVSRARHFGHCTVLSTHFATDILPNMRNQCTEAYVFRQDVGSAKALAKQFADPLFTRAPGLDIGQFIHKCGADIAQIKMLDLKASTARK